ncbi:MAG: acetoin utilization protein AcuC [Rhodobacter sp.]|nr:acetoin utilization protein AcuC [Rhodobacter sp.]MCA3513151.1 acetoin utilization protein AcuC [Rhodobacter sp.]MCA3521385.1 acetoin utilization protein AcuC [Rhodobacter sp.]MCA3521918.1 acetoin utilization protein AcuC [Rhodobacter sp.]MCA3526879.1 acetoin utilization protein AcuC [Rhodobacter sp.]
MGFPDKSDLGGNHFQDRAPSELTCAAGPLLVGAEIYRASSYGHGHPLSIPRVSTVMDLSHALGWLPASRFRRSPRAKPAALALWHEPDYLAALQAAEERGVATPEDRARYHLGTVSNPVFPEVFRRPATSAGGAMLAAELLRHSGVIYVPAGGTHHGLPGRANGFCYTNDPVLAMLVLRRAGVRRIAYVDIDAHHCDGVESAFAEDPEALLISVHEEGRWPFTGRLCDDGCGNCFNLPVPRGFNDTEMRAVLDRLILPRVAAFRPGAIVLQCGADALEEDPLSRLSLSNNAHWSVVAALRPLSPRYLVLGGGGYDPWSVGRCWTGVWATLCGQEIPDRLPAAAQDVLAALAQGRKPPAPHLMTTLRDVPREGPVRPEVADRLAALARR